MWNARFWDGVVTQKGQLRDCSTNLENRFYGARGDSLLGEDYQSANVEITPKLTIARRYGNSVWNSNLWTDLNSFYDFRQFNANEEQIKTIVDTKTFLYDSTNNSQTPIWQKNLASGQSYMQSVGNNLFWGDGVDKKKWLTTLLSRTPYTPQTFPNTQNPYNFTPFELNSFIIDTNGNVEQLVGTVLQLSSFYLLNNEIIFSLLSSKNGYTLPKAYEILTPGLQVYLPPSSQVAQFLGEANGLTLTVDNLVGGLLSSSVFFGGSGYLVNDVVSLNQTNPSGGVDGQVKILSVATASGTGYSSGTVTTTTTGSGVGATLSISVISGELSSAAVASGGTNYALGDFVIPSQSGGSGGYFVVTGETNGVITSVVVATGSATSIEVLVTGTGYYTASGVPVSGGTGQGLTLSVTSDETQFSSSFVYGGGSITSVNVNTPGINYLSGQEWIPVQTSQPNSGGAVLEITGLLGSVGSLSFVSGGPAVFPYTTGVPTYTTSGSGAGAAFNITGVTSGEISAISVTSAGSGYSVGDLIYITQGVATGAVLSVATLSGSGIATVTIGSGGLTGFTVASGVSTNTSGIGTGCTINITSVTNGSILSSGWSLSGGGTNYTVGDTVYPVQGLASGASFTVSAITGGVVTSLSTSTTPYSGYPVNTTFLTTGGTGVGATLQLQYTPGYKYIIRYESYEGINEPIPIYGYVAATYSLIVENGGTGYVVGDILFPTYAGSSGTLSGTVTAFSESAGSIASLSIINGGYGYVTATDLPLSPLFTTPFETGTGATVNIVVANESEFPLTDISDTSTVFSGGNPISDSRPNSSVSWGSVGQTTIDGSALWVNRGASTDGGIVYNWGLDGGTEPPVASVNTPSGSWEADTYFSQWQFIVVNVDGSEYLQQVLTGGKSGASTPTWNTAVGKNTTDGTVTWACIPNDGDTSLTWASESQYSVGHVLEETVSSLSCIFRLQPYSGITTEGLIPSYCWNTGSQSGLDVGSPAQLPGNIPMAQNGGQTTTTANYTSSTNCLYLTTGPSGSLTNLSVPTMAGDGTVSSSVTQLFPTGQNASIAMLPVFNVPTAGVYTFTLGHQLHTFWGIGNGSLNINVLKVQIKNNVLTITSDKDLTNILSIGNSLTFSGLTSATFLNSKTALITSVSGRTFTAAFTFSNYGPSLENTPGLASTGDTLTPSVISGPMNWNSKYNYSTGTPIKGYPIMSANLTTGDFVTEDTIQISFPSAGVYPAEIQHGMWYHSTSGYTTPAVSPALPTNTFCFFLIYSPPGSTINYNIIPQSLACSSAITPTFPAWPTTEAGLQAISPNYPSVVETSGNYTWFNLGPSSQFGWTAATNYNTESFIVDNNSNQEVPYEPGISSSAYPYFSLTLYGLTPDSGMVGSTGLIWMNNGPEGSTPFGEISTSQGGWSYVVSLVNTLDDTVSNASPASISTGNFFGANGVFISGGLPMVPDPQADYVAIFRTDDGGATYYLVPGLPSGNGNTEYTLPLSQYLTGGFTDTNLDSSLNTLLEAPVDKQNSPPPKGIINLAFHLSRIFGSVGNTTYWSTGPDTPIGNGYNGFSPNNFAEFPSLVTRIVPLNAGTLVFTVSDIYILSGNGESGSPIVPEPYVQRIGLLNYNALTINGTLIYFMTTDNQVVELNVHTGVSQIGQPIADLLGRFSPKKSYLTWHSSGYQDQALFTADGSTGWYKMLTAIPPEVGTPWCPKANIVGGAGSVQSCETTPGNLQLLIGPPPNTTGPILFRDYTNYQDNGTNYPAYFTFGSIVLAHPGQIASIEFFTVDSHKFVGAQPLTLGILLGEILGDFEPICNFVNDPPQLPPSNSLWNQRFYLMQSNEPIECRHFQLKVLWPAQNFPDEIESCSPFGGYSQEQ